MQPWEFSGEFIKNLMLQVSIIREGLAELFENEEEWSKAAQVLSAIDLDSGIRYELNWKESENFELQYDVVAR